MFAFGEEMKVTVSVPFGLLSRVFQLSYDGKAGTCFVVDLDERQYVVTARHLVPGIKTNDVVQILQTNGWTTLNVRPIVPADTNIDIVALAPDRLVVPHLEYSLGMANVILGQDVFFLGFPWGLGTQDNTGQIPKIAFMKKATLSAFDRIGAAEIVYLDGHNNKGFSGGPVVYGNLTQGNRLYVCGVVSGYRTEPALKPAKSKSDANVVELQDVEGILANSGIIIVHDIKGIEEAIRANPIGFR